MPSSLKQKVSGRLSYSCTCSVFDTASDSCSFCGIPVTGSLGSALAREGVHEGHREAELTSAAIRGAGQSRGTVWDGEEEEVDAGQTTV